LARHTSIFAGYFDIPLIFDGEMPLRHNGASWNPVFEYAAGPQILPAADFE
jgi:hypothetical protein